MMQGLKCFVAAVTDKASISQGSHVTWRPQSLALKNPANCSLLLQVMYKVAPIPGVLTAPLVIPATTVSSVDSNVEHWGIMQATTLYAQIKDFRRPTVSSLLQDS